MLIFMVLETIACTTFHKKGQLVLAAIMIGSQGPEWFQYLGAKQQNFFYKNKGRQYNEKLGFQVEP